MSNYETLSSCICSQTEFVQFQDQFSQGDAEVVVIVAIALLHYLADLAIVAI